MKTLEQQRAQLEGLVNTQIDPSSNLPINCRNCIHCEKHSWGSAFDRCMKSGGAYCDFVHQFPSIHGNLCQNYSAWAPRQKSILELIGDKIRKMLTDT